MPTMFWMPREEKKQLLSQSHFFRWALSAACLGRSIKQEEGDKNAIIIIILIIISRL